MDEDIQYRISLLAECIREKYDTPIPARDLKELVHKLGGSVDTSYGFTTIDKGLVAKTGDNSFSIRISNCHENDPRYMDYEVAKQLGHLILHMGYKISPETWKKYSADQNRFYAFSSDEQNKQAESFAYSLLMPQTYEEGYISAIEKQFFMNTAGTWFKKTLV